MPRKCFSPVHQAPLFLDTRGVMARLGLLSALKCFLRQAGHAAALFFLLCNLAQAKHVRAIEYVYLQTEKSISPYEAFQALRDPRVVRTGKFEFSGGDHDTWVMLGARDLGPDLNAFTLDFSHPPSDLQVWKWRRGVDIEILDGSRRNDRRDTYNILTAYFNGFHYKFPSTDDAEVYYIVRFRADRASALQVLAGDYIHLRSSNELKLLISVALVCVVVLLTLVGVNRWMASRSVQYGLYVMLSAGSLIFLLFAGLGLQWTSIHHPWLGLLAVCVSYVMVSYAYIGLSCDDELMSSRLRRRSLLVKAMLVIVPTLFAFVALFRQHWSIEVIVLHHFFAVILVCFIYTVISSGRAGGGLRTLIHCILAVVAGVLIVKFHDHDGFSLIDGLDWSVIHYLVAWVGVVALFYFRVARGGPARVVPFRLMEEAPVQDSVSQIDRPRDDEFKNERNRLSIIKHELKAPLVTIASLVRLHSEKFNSQSINEDLQTISRITEHSLSIIDQGLNEHEGADFEHSHPADAQVDLLLLSKELYALCRAHSQNLTTPFRLDIKRGTPRMVAVHPTKFRRIIINLLSNAFRYTHSGVVCLRFRLLARSGTTSLAVVVADTGMGMSKEALAAYMRPFVKSEESPGMGLGLALVSTLAEQVGASLRIKSRPQRGTIARLVMPLNLGLDTPHVHSLSDPVSFVSDPLREVANTNPSIHLAPEDVAKIRVCLMTGQVTELESHLSNLRSRCNHAPTQAWLDRVQHHLDLMDFSALWLLIEQIQNQGAVRQDETRNSPMT
jgi:signal transduction histidine kinase